MLRLIGDVLLTVALTSLVVWVQVRFNPWRQQMFPPEPPIERPAEDETVALIAGSPAVVAGADLDGTVLCNELEQMLRRHADGVDVYLDAPKDVVR